MSATRRPPIARTAHESGAARAMRLLRAKHPTWTDELILDLVRVPHRCAPSTEDWALITGLDIWTAEDVWPPRRRTA